MPLEQRERNGSDGAAEWNRHLADAEREPAFLLAEPRHHRSAARSVHAGGEPARDGQRDDERRERGGVRGPDERTGTGGQPGRDHDAFPDDVRDDAPDQQRHERAGDPGGEHDARLRQREVEVPPDRRRDRG